MIEQTDAAVTRESLLERTRVLDAQNRDLRNEIETLRKVIDILHSSRDSYRIPYTSPAIPMPGTTPATPSIPMPYTTPASPPASPPWWWLPTITCCATN